jgi:Putative lumazine-binding
MKPLIFSLCLFFTLTAAAEQPSDKRAMQMKNYNADSTDIADILNDAYFKGIYEGDINLLGSTYYSGTLLFGDAAGKPYFKTLAQYLDGVKNRQSPKDSGKPFKGEIISIQLINSIAIAEVKVKMYDFNYHEFLSFHKLDGKWLIVNKMISDVKE